MQSFSQFLVESGIIKSPTNKMLANEFSIAIARHISLPTKERIESTRDAARRVGDIYGYTESGKVRPLLGTNTKIMKAEVGTKTSEPLRLADGRGVSTAVLNLSPAYQQGSFNTCPRHQACKDFCLGKTSGQYFMAAGRPEALANYQGPLGSALGRTHTMLTDPQAFAVRLHDEIRAHSAIADIEGNQPAIRLNGLSDIHPHVYAALITAHPEVQFYDYTKNNYDTLPSGNHHLTYSSTGLHQPQHGIENPNQNWGQMRRRLDNGDNVAMVFSHKSVLPTHVRDLQRGEDIPVVDGTIHDYRPADATPKGERGVIVGLKNRATNQKNASAAEATNGFMVHFDPKKESHVDIHPQGK